MNLLNWRLLTCVGLTYVATAASAQAATVLTMNGVQEISPTLPAPTDLWVRSQDLPKIDGFELKPEGACLDDICVPIRQQEDSSIFVQRSGAGWVNATELARRVQQPVVADYTSDTWSFGAIPVQRQAFHNQGIAPDFTLPDWQGNQVSLSDFQGKNIMLLSWASW
ncbi:MAG: redoxin domain-containing protein [Pseudomonadales bacterium]